MNYAAALSKRHLVPVGKVIISLALVGIILAQFNFPFFFSHWHRLNPLAVAASLAILAIQTTVIAGTRLKLVLECLGTKHPLARTSQVAICGFFFEQVAIGFVGGDAMRLWLLHRMGILVRKALGALFIDRCLGVAGLLLLVLIGLPGLMQLLPDFDGRKIFALASATILLFFGAIFVVFLVIPAKYRRHPLLLQIMEFASAAVRDAYIRNRLLLVLALATVTQLSNVLIMFIIGRDLGLPVSFHQWFFIIPAVLLFSMIPISAGGWGLREGILIFALRGFGIPPEEAIVPSIVFGLGVLVVTLPGGIIWLLNRGRNPNGDKARVIGIPRGDS